MNRSFNSNLESDHYLPLRRSYYKLLQELLEGNSESANKYSMLNPECNPSELKVFEWRKAEWVKFYVDAYNAGVDPDTLPDVNSCEDYNYSSINIA